MLQPGDIIFVRGSIMHPLYDAIMLGEEILDKQPFISNYVHVAVYMGGDTIAEAKDFRKSGFGPLSQYAGNYDIGHIQMTTDQRQRFLSGLLKENGLPYDWLGIFWLIVKIVTGYDRKYQEHKVRYCSKYVGWALAKVGIVVNDRTPEDLALDPLVTIEKRK